MLAIIRIRDDPRTALYIARQRANGKTKREAIRNLKRHLARRVYHLLHDPNNIPTTICLT
jgi:transposase